MKTLKERIKSLPNASGVYLMKDVRGQVIYVGKAISIKKRVRSYFNKVNSRDVSSQNQGECKTSVLIKNVVHIDYVCTFGEAEALILEASLIKTHKPRYNVLLLDDKSYPLVELTDHCFPRVVISRPKVRNNSSVYYGPYVNARLLREALTLIRKIIPFRVCHPFPKKECLDYHMGLCQAPCINEISKKDYEKNIRNVRLILEGRKDQLYKCLNRDMDNAVRQHNYELAAKIRDQLRSLGSLYSGAKDINYYTEAEQLRYVLNLPRLPERIETFDISNILGQQAVGSMVFFLNGNPDKRSYRRFKIKMVEGIDDFKMMYEVVFRRYKRLRDEKKRYPDLIVVDGGKGQLRYACKALEELGLSIPIIALAKRNEEVFLLRKRLPVCFSHHCVGLQLLQRMRDEAHRFALSYHRKLRDKAFYF